MNHGRWRLLLAACLVPLAAALCQPSPAPALPPPDPPFVFNEPFVRQTAPEVTVFDWSVSKCEDNDIPDEPARAFRDDSGNVQLMDTHLVNYRWIGTALDGSLTHPCTRTMSSSQSSDPSTYNNFEWLASPWTPDGKNVYALVHNEYRGIQYQTGCSSWEACWHNTITSAFSTNSGQTFTQRAAPGHTVATLPYQFTKDGPHGYFTPSNIVRAGDGYFYSMFRAQPKGAQQMGTCLMRTRDLSDPTSWRAWNGSGFVVQFGNPYTATIDPAQHVCATVDTNSIGTMSESLTYNTYLRKWMLVGASVGNPANGLPPGIYYALSDDLLEWTNLDVLFEGEVVWVNDCTPPDPIKDPSLLDPASTSRNFETVGQRGQLFYTHYHFSGCNGTLDRDLIRIPIEFSNQQPGGPSAALTASTHSASVGQPVRFDASGSSDSDGTVTRYQWDLDGDGGFERDTGADPVTSTSFSAAKQVTVTVRVSDDDGKSTDETEIVQVKDAPSRPPVCKRAHRKRKRACRASK
jgi:PKD domain